MIRLRVHLRGAVQGVGFRPFVYRVAKELRLKGYVLNDTFGVEIEVEGKREDIERFLLKLREEKPPLARIHSKRIEFLEPFGYEDFEIRDSVKRKGGEISVLPDVATCKECLGELFDPENRRYLYPFINCTDCGPRFTIVTELPYDRENTTMRSFRMCPECEREYRDPLSRRFHAQANACPRCGPHVSLYSAEGKKMAEGGEALKMLTDAIRKGKIAAVKGVGGFHLICNATEEKIVRTLRERKRRKEKPFAVMFKDLQQLERYAEPTDLERSLLLSPERPIVLVRKKKDLAPSVSPGLRKVGAMLPYSPLHHILLSSLDFPIVATSGNLSEEPIVKDNGEAFEKLSSVADLILIHDKEIRRRCDDSVIKVIGGIPTPVRRSRGYVPLPVSLPFKVRRTLAVGGMLKNTFALALEDKVFLSQHVGDTDSLTTMEVFEESVLDMFSLYRFEPEAVACDLHPKYETTKWAERFARERGIELLRVQHHHAHILSCMAENGVRGRVLGIAWDGTGLGDDGTLWGGEFLIVDYEGYERVFHFKPLKLIGGERAVKEPWRVAVSILFHLYGREAISLIGERYRDLSEREVENLYVVWERGINSPPSSSVGRLFDAVSSLLGIRQTLSYEGQGAMMIEDLYDPSIKDHYPFDIEGKEVDWRPVFEAILKEEDTSIACSRFINTLAHVSLEIARIVGVGEVCLSGGVMQNDPLVTKMKELLSREGFRVYIHRLVPPNDGGLALGQAVCKGRV